MSVINLPLLPLLKAFGHLSDLDMINLSFCSQRTAQLVNTSKRFTSTSTILYDANKECYEISVCTSNSHFMIRLKPRGQEVPTRFIGGMDVHGTISFRGFEMHFLKPIGRNEPSGIFFYDTREDFVVLHEALTEHFLDLYVTPPQLILGLAPSNILTYPFLKNWKKWDRVTMSQYSSRSVVSSEEMRFLLNDSEYTNDLTLRRDVQNGFEYSEGFRLNRIHFSHSSWAQIDCIINSTSREIILDRFPTPTASQLINLLKLWVAKEKMVNLEFLRFDSVLHFDWNVIGCEERKREVWRGIGLSTLGEATKGEILRVDGVRAEVDMRVPNFCLYVVNE